MKISGETCDLQDELFIGRVKVERVAGFKLLGIYITSDLKWNTHTLTKFVQKPPRGCTP